MSRVRVLLAGVFLWTACLGDEQQPGPRRVAIDPDVVNFSRHGDQLVLAGRTYRGIVLSPDSSQFVWRSVDSTVAAVTTDGVVTARGDGVTRIWGVAGPDSAFAVVVVQSPTAPAMVAVSPSQIRFSALTAVALLTVTSSDSLAIDSVPACRSDNPQVAVVESLTVRAQGNGSTRIRCSVDGVEGSSVVTVRQRIARVAVRSDRDLALRVGRDSLVLMLARVDSMSQPVAGGVPVFASLDTAIVKVDPVEGTMIALALGNARVVGTIENFADTALVRVVEIAPPPTISNVNVRRVGGAAGSSTRRPGVRTSNRQGVIQGSSAQVGSRDFQARDSIFQGGTLGAARPPRWIPTLLVAPVERRSDQGLGLDFGYGRSTGITFGLELEATPTPRAHFKLWGVAGRLTAKPGTSGESGTVGEAQLEAGYAMFPWLWAYVGGGRRSFQQEALATVSHLTTARAGVEARYGFGKRAMQGVVRLAYIPVVDYTAGQADYNAFFGALAISGEAGVSFRTGIFSAGVNYALERFRFPQLPTGRQQEHFSALRIRLGFELGR